MSPEERAEINLLYQLAHSKAQHGGAINAVIVVGAIMTLEDEITRLHTGIARAAATLVKWAHAGGGHTPSAVIAGYLRDLLEDKPDNGNLEVAPETFDPRAAAKAAFAGQFRFDVFDEAQWPTRLIVPDEVLSKMIAQRHKRNVGIDLSLESGMVHLIGPVYLHPAHGPALAGTVVGLATCLGLLDNKSFDTSLGQLDWQDWIVPLEEHPHVTCPKCIERGLAKAYGHDDG
jgi:hypothetical protein